MTSCIRVISFKRTRKWISQIFSPSNLHIFELMILHCQRSNSKFECTVKNFVEEGRVLHAFKWENAYLIPTFQTEFRDAVFSLLYLADTKITIKIQFLSIERKLTQKTYAVGFFSNSNGHQFLNISFSFMNTCIPEKFLFLNMLMVSHVIREEC